MTRKKLPTLTRPGHAVVVGEAPNYVTGYRWRPECECGWVGMPNPTKRQALGQAEGSHYGHLIHQERIAQAEAEAAEKNVPAPRCPTPDKLRFKTRAKADRNMHDFWRRRHRGRDAATWPSRSYLCPCGYWHLTTKARR